MKNQARHVLSLLPTYQWFRTQIGVYLMNRTAWPICGGLTVPWWTRALLVLARVWTVREAVWVVSWPIPEKVQESKIRRTVVAAPTFVNRYADMTNRHPIRAAEALQQIGITPVPHKTAATAQATDAED
jgi:hypothetical protein